MACKYSNSRIADELEREFSLYIPKFPRLPTKLLAFGADGRPGLNSKKITSDIISQFSKVGIENGDNVWEKYTALVVETLIDAIVYDATVSVGIKPTEIQVISQGGNAGGPVISVGQNITPVGARGIIS